MEKLTVYLLKKKKKKKEPLALPHFVCISGFSFLDSKQPWARAASLSGRVLLSSPERHELWQVLGTQGRGCSWAGSICHWNRLLGWLAKTVNKHKFVCLMDTQLGQTSLNVRVWSRETIITGPSKNRWLVWMPPHVLFKKFIWDEWT